MPLASNRLVLACLLTTAAVVGLTACVPSGEPVATPTPSASSSSPTPTPTPTPTADAGTPVTIACDELITPDDLYAYNPNVALIGAFDPVPGSVVASIVADNGIACRWQNASSGETIELAVANLSADRLTTLKNDLVMTSNSVPTYGVEGYFEVENGVGTANAFDDPYWIVGQSTAFFEPGDASPLMTAAIANLG